MIRIIAYLSIAALFVGCATEQTIDPKDVVPEPHLAAQINNELSAIIGSQQCNVIGCISFKSEPLHFACIGEYSFILPGTAEEKFKIAVDKVRAPGTTVDLTADEGVGSQLMAAFFRGVGAGMAAGMTGGGGANYSGVGSSSPVQFTSAGKPTGQ